MSILTNKAVQKFVPCEINVTIAIDNFCGYGVSYGVFLIHLHYSAINSYRL